MILDLGKYLLIGLGVLFAVNTLLTAFGSIHSGKFRQKLNQIVTIGGKVFLIYLALSLIFLTFQGLSKDPSFKAVIGNIFLVVLVVVLIVVLGADFFPDRNNKN